MAESAALLVDEVFPAQPVRQWVLSFPYPLRFLFASRPAIMGRVLGIVYRCIATHLIKAASGILPPAALVRPCTSPRRTFSGTPGAAGARCRKQLSDRGCRGRRSAESTLGAFHDVHGSTNVAGGRMPGAATYRIAVGPHQGRKVFTLQTLADSNEPFDDRVGKVAGFSLHAGVAAKADERKKLERLCRDIALHGCRVLRRLGTIASAQGPRCRKSGCRCGLQGCRPHRHRDLQ